MKKSITEIQTSLKEKSKIDPFYFELLAPVIPTGILQRCEQKDLALLLQNIVHIVGKRLVGERSILDNKLAYKNLSVTQNKNIKKGKQAA